MHGLRSTSDGPQVSTMCRFVRTLTVVSPVYNEAEVVESFYEALKETLVGLASRYDSTMLFVVDRSRTTRSRSSNELQSRMQAYESFPCRHALAIRWRSSLGWTTAHRTR